MKNRFYIFFLLCSTACTYNSEEELGAIIPGGIEESIIFSESVRPIINQNCAITGCHVAGEPRPDFSLDQEVVDHAQEIKVRVLNGSMPRMGSLTFQEKDTLISWINQGAILQTSL